MSKILVATATYNEVKNIKNLIKKICQVNKNLDILVVDDNSPDGTANIIKKIKKKNLFLIFRKKKYGLDTAHKEIYNFAIKKKYKILITMDADLAHDPKVIPKLLKYIKNYDCVVGSRYIKGGQNKLKGFRLLLSIFGNLLIKKILNIPLSEFTSSYRCFNLSTLKNFNFNEVNFKGYSFFMGTINLIYEKQYRIKEIPITVYQRKNGKSKIPKIEIFRTLKNLIKIKFKQIKLISYNI